VGSLFGLRPVPRIPITVGTDAPDLPPQTRSVPKQASPPRVSDNAVLPPIQSPKPKKSVYRPEAKRWCFTLNNPCLADVYSEEYPIDPSIYDYLVAGNEKGESGTPHLQGFIIFKKKMRLSAVKKVFQRAHWEISQDENLTRAANYCKKGEQTHDEWEQHHEDGPNYGLNADFAEFGTLPSPNSCGSHTRQQGFALALQAEDVTTALSVIQQHNPKEYVLHRSQIHNNLQAHFHVTPIYKPRYSLDMFCHPPLHFSDQHATLVWGDTNLGKTAFVKAHFKNPLFIRHMDRLKEFTSAYDAIIFDDMSFQHLPISTVIYLLDTDDDADIHVRYGVAKIPANTVKVFTHNTSNPFYNSQAEASQIAAVERRYKSFHVGNKLFK